MRARDYDKREELLEMQWTGCMKLCDVTKGLVLRFQTMKTLKLVCSVHFFTTAHDACSTVHGRQALGIFNAYNKLLLGMLCFREVFIAIPSSPSPLPHPPAYPLAVVVEGTSEVRNTMR